MKSARHACFIEHNRVLHAENRDERNQFWEHKSAQNTGNFFIRFMLIVSKSHCLVSRHLKYLQFSSLLYG